MRKKLSDSERILRFYADQELDLYRRSAFDQRGEFLWERWPFSERLLAVLIAAARSSKIACKGGLINERRQPDEKMRAAADDLRALGLLGARESLEEFQPTKLGWAMLEHFATPEELMPPDSNDSSKRYCRPPRNKNIIRRR